MLWALPVPGVRTFVKTLLPSTTTAALHCAKVTHRVVAFQDVAEGTGAVAGSESALYSRVSAIHQEGYLGEAAHRREAAGPFGALATSGATRQKAAYRSVQTWAPKAPGSKQVISVIYPLPHAKEHPRQGALTPRQAKSISHSCKCSISWHTKASTEGPIGLRLNTRHTRILKLNDIICQNSSFLT